MNKICTSIEQSKKLIELGIDIKTSDMYYSYDYNINEYDDDAQIIPQSELGQHFSLFPEDIPAWSLSALLNYLREIDYFPEIDVDEFEVTMRINYYNEDEARPLAPIHNITVKAESFIDACYEMIITLNELKLL